MREKKRIGKKRPSGRWGEYRVEGGVCDESYLQQEVGSVSWCWMLVVVILAGCDRRVVNPWRLVWAERELAMGDYVLPMVLLRGLLE